MFKEGSKQFTHGLDRTWVFVQKKFRPIPMGMGQGPRNAPRRAMAAALCLVMLLGMLPASAFAAEADCTHQHSADCGYLPAAEAVPCDKGCAETDEEGNLLHADNCAYLPAEAGSPCTHVHDADCGGLNQEEPDTSAAAEPLAEVHSHDDSTTYDTPLTQTSGDLTAGSYYLTDNLSLSDTLSVPDGVTVNLCLNGKALSPSSTSSYPIQLNGGTLNLYDCGSDGKVTATSNHGIFNNGGTVNIYGGTVSSENYRGIQSEGGTVNIYGGTVSSESYNGIRSEGGTVHIYGGAVSSTYDHAIYVSSSGKIYLSGGSVTTTSSYNGINMSRGDLYLSGTPTIAVQSGAPIHINLDYSKLSANNGDQTQPQYYTGSPLAIKFVNGSSGEVAVYGVNDGNKESFTFWGSSDYGLAVGTGENTSNLLIKGEDKTLAWYDEDNATQFTGEGYPATGEMDSKIDSLPAVPAKDGQIPVGWLFSTDGGTNWDTSLFTTSTSLTADTRFKALYVPAFAGGSGTASDPYQISTAEQLQGLATLVNSGASGYNSAYYQLTAETLDLSSVCGEGVGSWTPIAAGGAEFRGTFDGNGKTISGLYINEDDSTYLGLFGYLSGTVTNLTLTGVSVIGNQYVGAVAAYADSSSSITGCTVSGAVAGHQDVGAVAGKISSSATLTGNNIDGCTVTVLPPEGYTPDGNGIMAYMKDYNSIDVQGFYKGNWIPTTYSSNGYVTVNEAIGSSSITPAADFINDGRYVKLSYTVTAGSSPITDGKLSVHADVKIGDNDRAAIEVIQDGDGKVIGLKMVNDKTSSSSHNAQFSLYFADTGGVTPVSTYWFGHYTDRSSNYYSQLDSSTASSDGDYVKDGDAYVKYSGSDSGMAFSWKGINLAANESKTFSVILGVGEKSDPPAWVDQGSDIDSPVRLTLDAEQEGNNHVKVSAKVTHVEGKLQTLYYDVDGGEGKALGDFASGSLNDTISQTLDISGLSVGSHDLHFWVVNSSGAASPSVTKTITIAANGEIGGLDPEPPAATPPAITTATLPGGTVGTAYSQALSATGTDPIAWSVTAGTLPAGLTLSGTGVISGTPTTAGTATFTVTATNDASPDATKELSIVIAAAASAQGGAVTLPLSQSNLDQVFGAGGATANTGTDPDTIQINQDLKPNDSITIPGDVVIDLNGHTVTGPDGNSAIIVTGNGSDLAVTGPGCVIGGAGTGPNGNGAPAIKNDGTDGSVVTVDGGASITGGAGTGTGSGGAGIDSSTGGGHAIVGGGSTVTGGIGGSAGGAGGNGVTGGTSSDVAVGAPNGPVTGSGTVTGGNGGTTGGTGGGGIVTGGDIAIGPGSAVTGGNGGSGTTTGGNGGNGSSSTDGSITVIGSGSSTAGGNGGDGTTSGGQGGSGANSSGNITVNNGGGASGGNGGDGAIGGAGGSGVDTSGNVTVGSGSSATGGTGGNGTSGGNGGNGADTSGSGTVTVDKGGSASGGQGGSGTTGSGGAGGNGTQAENGSTTNSGTTIGGQGGSASSGTGGNGGSGSGTTGGGITVNPGGNAGGGQGGNGATGGTGGDGTSTSGSGSTTVNGGANGGQGGTSSGSGQAGGNGGSGSSSSGSGSVDVGTSGSATGGQGGLSDSGNGGTGGNGSTSTGSGSVNVGGGGTSTGGIGGAGGSASGNAGGTGGSGTSTGSGGNTTVDGTITGGTGGQGGTDASGGNGGSGGSGANEDGIITGSGTITGGNGGNVPEGGGGQPGTGGSAITGGGSAAIPGPTTTDGKKGVNAKAEVDNTQNDSGATITVSKEDMVDAAVTDEERGDSSITKIDVALNIVNKTAEKPNAGAVSNALAGTGATEVGVYLDITLEKSVTKTTGDPIKTLVTDAVKPLTLTITIPESMRGGSNFTVIRVHGSEATALPTRYEPVNHTLTITSDKFSTYAIAYTPETPVTPPYDGGGDSSATSSAPAPIVTKADGGTVTLNPTSPKPGQTVTVMPKPDEGYVVNQITVTDKDGKDVPVKENSDGTYSFTQPKIGVTVTVTFKSVEVRLLWNPFTDVAESDWFYDSVKYVYENGLMNGTASDKFSPYTTTSRSMIVTILWRLEGEPDAAGTNPFDDVPADAYYAAAIAWATENGIVKGYDNSSFGPNDSITREQLASILYRYAQFKGMETPTEGMAIGNFSDNDQVSAYAGDAMRWALGQGIISGKGNGILAPKGEASRAEAASMLERFLT